MPAINDEDVKLMLAMIASAEGLKTDNEKLANIIGNGVTPNAIRQRVSKIKNQAKAVLDGGTPETNLKSSKAKQPKTTPTAKPKRPVPTSDEDEGEESPSKKRDSGTKGKQAENEMVKTEIDEDGNEL